MREERLSYDDLRHYEFAHPELKKFDIARQLGVRPSRYSQLRNPLFPSRPSDREKKAIAQLLNRPLGHVSKLYDRAA